MQEPVDVKFVTVCILLSLLSLLSLYFVDAQISLKRRY